MVEPPSTPSGPARPPAPRYCRSRSAGSARARRRPARGRRSRPRPRVCWRRPRPAPDPGQRRSPRASVAGSRSSTGDGTPNARRPCSPDRLDMGRPAVHQRHLVAGRRQSRAEAGAERAGADDDDPQRWPSRPDRRGDRAARHGASQRVGTVERCRAALPTARGAAMAATPARAPLYSVTEMRRLARRALPRPVFDFADGGAEDERTLRRNEAAFDDVDAAAAPARRRRRARPVASTLFGQRLSLPVMIGPTGLAGLLWPDGELATARARPRPPARPTASATARPARSRTLPATGAAPRWMQVFIYQRPRLHARVRRARRRRPATTRWC